jgi:hypothetical protein
VLDFGPVAVEGNDERDGRRGAHGQRPEWHPEFRDLPDGYLNVPPIWLGRIRAAGVDQPHLRRPTPDTDDDLHTCGFQEVHTQVKAAR